MINFPWDARTVDPSPDPARRGGWSKQPKSASPDGPPWQPARMPADQPAPLPQAGLAPAVAVPARALSVRTGARMPLPSDPAAPVVEYLGRRPLHEYSPAFVTAFCDAIADGATVHSLSLRQDMPSRPTIRAWMTQHPEFAGAYAIAWRARADARSDRMDAIAERVGLGQLDPQAGRVMLANETWQASRENAGKYGERVSVAAIPPPPIPGNQITLDPNNPRDVERIVMSVFANVD